MGMIKTVWDAIVRMFRGKREALPKEQYPVEAAIAPAADQQTAIVALATFPKSRPRKPAAVEVASMAGLLDSLDEVFSVLRMPFNKGSLIQRSTAIGLRKLGVHVTHPSCEHDTSTAAFAGNKNLPAMICVSLGTSMYDSEENVHPAIIYAVKVKSVPASIDKCEGQHYQFGFGVKGLFFMDGVKEKGEFFWISGYATVMDSGEVHIHKERTPQQVVINTRNRASRRFAGRTVSYTKNNWHEPYVSEVVNNENPAERNRAARNLFAIAMNWWLQRKNNWSVSVKKNGERITFSIPKELTSKFFKDRIKVKNDAGSTRRIIHYVNSHERVLANGDVSQVKAHIRGLADFSWKGYMCHVVAPKFNGLISTEFTPSAEEIGTDDNEPRKGYIDASKIGAVLARLEDGEQRIAA